MSQQQKVSKSIWDTSTNVRKRHPKITLRGNHKFLAMNDKKFRMLMIDAYDFTDKASKRMPTPKTAEAGDD